MKREAIALVLLAGSGCAVSHQSALDPAGPQAHQIAALWWFFTALLGSIFAIVIGLTIWPLFHQHHGINQEPLEHRHYPSDQTERKLGRVVVAATGLTLLILLGLIVISV